ncbi:ribose 5-phosphate isomerase B [Desulfogranum mediterraneum]|uniref:ribose 5-phosphate isomerase B n=1 Tax=Desulfogranum mediterraneum TaxID=160661 RepID=UPI00040198AE|nr:ribose 5-phosphate isomerase B [Desulfogranum mediterraneum]
MKIALGCDHGGFGLKQEIAAVLKDCDCEVVDYGCYSSDSVDYPDIAAAVCKAVAGGECERGILICGTGIGISIAANRHPGIRAALCSEPFSAQMSREHNDANVLCLGGRVIGGALALQIVDVWLKTEFSGGRHLRRIQMLD